MRHISSVLLMLMLSATPGYSIVTQDDIGESKLTCNSSHLLASSAARLQQSLYSVLTRIESYLGHSIAYSVYYRLWRVPSSNYGHGLDLRSEGLYCKPSLRSPTSLRRDLLCWIGRCSAVQYTGGRSGGLARTDWHREISNRTIQCRPFDKKGTVRIIDEASI